MKIKIDDKVAYSVQWLKSTGQSHGYMSQARGIVTDLIPLGDNFLAVVEWNDEDVPTKVLTQNLAIVGLNTKFCQC